MSWIPNTQNTPNSVWGTACSLPVSGITSGIIYAITWFEACSQLCSDSLTSHLRLNEQFSSVSSKKRYLNRLPEDFGRPVYHRAKSNDLQLIFVISLIYNSAVASPCQARKEVVSATCPIIDPPYILVGETAQTSSLRRGASRDHTWMYIRVLPSAQLLIKALLSCAWSALCSLLKRASKYPLLHLLLIFHRKPNLVFWTLLVVMEMTATYMHSVRAGKAPKYFVGLNNA